MINDAFIAGFLDDLVKVATDTWREQLESRSKEIGRRHEVALNKIFNEKVPERLLAMVKRRFPGFETAAKPASRKPAALSKTAVDIQDIVHHPLVQAIGYGALAGEGVHALAHMAGAKRPNTRFGKFMTGSPYSKGLNIGAIGLSSAFLAAEGASALADLFRKKPHEASSPNNVINLKLTLQPPDLPGQPVSAGLGRSSTIRFPRMSPGLRRMVSRGR